ncbi:MAG: hypothetical protein AAFU68_02705 [Pseudomonadota bacterium]
MTEPIREATVDDLPHIVKMGRLFHLRAYRNLPVGYDTPTATDFARGLIESDNGVIFISHLGMCGGLVAPFYMSTTLQASEVFWFAQDGLGDALRRRFEDWAKDKGAKVCTFSALRPVRGKAVERILKTAGYHHHETALVKVI